MNWRKWFNNRDGDEERRYQMYKARFLYEQKRDRELDQIADRPTSTRLLPAISSREEAGGSATLTMKGSGA